MTPLNEANYYGGDESQVYMYRIGHVPLNLDKLGDVPSSGEISDEVSEYITLRLKWKQEYDEWHDEWKRKCDEYDSRIAQWNEGTTLLMNTRTGNGAEKNREQVPSMGKHSPVVPQQCVREEMRDGSSSSSSSTASHYPVDDIMNGAVGDVQCYFGLKCQFNSSENGSNIQKAVEWYTKAAEQGHLLALMILHYCYFKGLGVEKNNRTANEFVNKFNRSLKTYQREIEKKEYDLSFKLIEQLLVNNQQQHELLQHLMGVCFSYGFGVKKSKQQAVKWHRLAAEQGNAIAQFNLGYCFKNGIGVEKSFEEAVKWYRLAANQQYATAQNNLGVCYYSGEGVEKDFGEAVKWYRLAADQGYAVAQNNLGFCYQKGQGVEKDYKEAAKWYRLAADQGLAMAQRLLGDCYRYGNGVAKSDEEAVKWYRLSADQGDATAKKALQQLLQSPTTL